MKYSILTETGAKKNNQDSVLFVENKDFWLAMVCDGLGGHFAGEVASSLVVKTFKSFFNKKNLPKFLNKVAIYDWYLNTISAAREQMFELSKKDERYLDTKTTMTSVFFLKKAKKAFVLNSGDSRVYSFSNNQELEQITKDHNRLNFVYLEKDKLTLEQALKTDDWDRIVSSIGPKSKFFLNIFEINAEDLTYFLLSSDGVFNFLSNKEFQSILSSKKELDNIAISLLKTAINNQSDDNLSLILVGLNK